MCEIKRGFVMGNGDYGMFLVFNYQKEKVLRRGDLTR